MIRRNDMDRRDLSLNEKLKSLQDSLQSEFEEEQIVAQILLREVKYEKSKKHINYLPCKRME